MSTLNKTLSLLDFFGPSSLHVGAEIMIERTGMSKATVYRYLKDLCEAGLLMRVSSGSYALGARIIELDWMMRQYDPILLAGRELLEQLAEETRLAVFTSSFYDNRIINTYIVEPNEPLAFRFGRGQPMPLFSGAQSKVLVAHQSGRRLRKLYDTKIATNEGGHAETQSWANFSRVVRKIRKDGYCMTSGELTAGLTGIAAPIFALGGKEPISSLAVVGQADRFELLRPESVIKRVVDTACSIADNLNRNQA